MSVVWFPVAIFLGITDIVLIFIIQGWLGWGVTLLWLFTAGVVGLGLLKACRRELHLVSQRGDPGQRGLEALGRAAAFGISGSLFLLPGVLSDIVALIFLVPPLRRGLLKSFFRWAALDIYGSMTYGVNMTPGSRRTDPAGEEGSGQAYPGNIRDVEFEVLDDSSARTRPRSGPPDGSP